MTLDLLLLFILLPPLVGAALNGIFGRRFSQGRVSWIACGASGSAAVAALLAAWTFSHLPSTTTPYYHEYFTWLESDGLRAPFALYYDRLTLVMTVTVTVVAFLIHLYSRGYMAHEGGYYRFFCYLNLFLFMMLLLVIAANYPLLFVGWEGVGLCSYLLISFYFRKKSAADAGKKAFIVTRIGDAGFTVGLALLFWTVGSLEFTKVFARVSGLANGELQTTLTAVGILLFLGAVGKSAQIPLYVWLPDAMEGPTPVSALIHAATMVTAGVYLVARSSIIFAHAPAALELVGTIGCVTAFFAATIALTQNDLKRLLAYSTISQLGYMFIACGAAVFAAGIFHLMTHAFFKSLLFLAAGSVMHALRGELDIQKMGGLRNKLKITYWTFLVGALAISGFPFLSGFFSKDAILVGAYEGPLAKTWIYLLATVTAGLTSFYMFRAVFLAFHGESRLEPETARHVHESPGTMTRPLIALAFFSVVAGYVSWPKALGGDEWFHHYLAPVFGPAEEVLRATAAHESSHLLGPGVIMLISTVVALGGIAVAFWFYLKRTELPAQLATRFRGLYQLLINKYYVDEFYHWLVVRPLSGGSERLLWQKVDAKTIDGFMVDGTAAVTARLGGVLRLIQSGNLRSYATWLLLGVVIWLGYVLFWS